MDGNLSRWYQLENKSYQWLDNNVFSSFQLNYLPQFT